MFKSKFKSLLAVVLVLGVMATMLSFALTANAATTVTTWTGLGLVDAVPNALDTTVTQDATTIYGVKGRWGADYAINASEEFDLSGGFTFSWTGNYQWNHYNGYYHAVSIGNLTIAAECIEGGPNKHSKVYVIHNNNSDNLVLSPMSDRRGVTGVYGTTLTTVDIYSTKLALNFTVAVSGGKLSLTVGDSTGLSESADNVNVSDIDFSAVTFGLKSIVSDGIDWYKFTNPNLTIQDASGEDTSSEDTSSEDPSSEDTSSEDTSSEDTSSEDTSSEDTSSEDTSSEDTSSTPLEKGDAPFNTEDWSALGLSTSTSKIYGYSVGLTCTAANIIVPNAQNYNSSGRVEGDKYIDLSDGFTFSWNMGDSGWNLKREGVYLDAPTGVRSPYYCVVQIGDLAVVSTRGKGTDMAPYGSPNPYNVNAKVYLVKLDSSEDAAAVVPSLDASVPTEFGVYGTVLASYDVKDPETETTPYYGNYKRDYTLTVKNGKATLSMNETNIFTNVDVSDIYFGNANFAVKAAAGYSGGASFTSPKLVAVSGGSGGNGGTGGNGGSGSNGGTGSNGGNGVDSGDTTNLLAFIALAIVAAGGVLLTVRKKSSAR